MNQEEEALWFCVRAQPKREHIAAGHLQELEGVEVFCPRLRYRKATRRGKIWWVEPLFPGYLLAKFNLGQMERAVTFCQGVSGLIRFGGKIPSVPESFVRSIQAEMRDREESEGDVLTITPVVEIGDEVEIANGPLQGMKGSIVSVAPAGERVKVLLEFLGAEQAVDLDLFSILMPRRPQL